MDIKIKQTKDFRVIAELNEPVQTLHHQLYPDEFKKYDQGYATTYFEKILSSEDWFAYIAEVDSQPIAYLLCNLKTRNENDFQYEKKVLYVDQLSVNVPFRKLGVGKLLVDEARELAKELQADEIQLDHWVKNDEAGKFFNALGFEYYNYKMKL